MPGQAKPSQQSATFRLGYRPALDGLRGVAVLAVLLFHTPPIGSTAGNQLPGGFLGVDVFFVLSGFLITSLLLEECAATGGVSFRGFYVRRALRLLPALAPVVVVAGAAMIASDVSWRTVGFVLAVILYVANWAIVCGLPQGLLGHTWSLAIEEQFYLLWPPLLLILLRWTRRRGTLLIIVAAAAGLAVAYRFAIMMSATGMARIYVGLDAHADPLLIGCALAIFCSSSYFRRRSRAAIVAWNLLGVVGGACLLVLLIRARFPVDYVLSSVSTWAAIATAAVIVSVLLPASPCEALLRMPLLVWIGRRSYALYLWHLPVFYLAGPLWRPGAEALEVKALAWAVCFALAAGSFVYLEQPALRLKHRLVHRSLESRLYERPTTSIPVV